MRMEGTFLKKSLLFNKMTLIHKNKCSPVGTYAHQVVYMIHF
jgi:hypothetical protein